MLIKQSEHRTFALENFEGPLSFLLHLVQKSEIPIADVPLRKLVQQYAADTEYRASDLNDGAEFINTTASLIWLKSKTLLPHRPNDEECETIEERSPFEILPKLLEYCYFKEVAKNLADLELNQTSFYPRGKEPTSIPRKKLHGIEKISFDQLEQIFQQILTKYSQRKGVIREEIWLVKDKIHFFRDEIQAKRKISFGKIFSKLYCKKELIVSFLAILEMMKLGELQIISEETGYYIYVE